MSDPDLDEDLAEGIVEGYVADDTGAPVAQVRLDNGDLAEYQAVLGGFETPAPAPGKISTPEEITAAAARVEP